MFILGNGFGVDQHKHLEADFVYTIAGALHTKIMKRIIGFKVQGRRKRIDFAHASLECFCSVFVSSENSTLSLGHDRL